MRERTSCSPHYSSTILLHAWHLIGIYKTFVKPNTFECYMSLWLFYFTSHLCSQIHISSHVIWVRTPHYFLPFSLRLIPVKSSFKTFILFSYWKKSTVDSHYFWTLVSSVKGLTCLNSYLPQSRTHSRVVIECLIIWHFSLSIDYWMGILCCCVLLRFSASSNLHLIKAVDSSRLRSYVNTLVTCYPLILVDFISSPKF